MPDLITNANRIGQPGGGGFDQNNNVRTNPVTPADKQIQNVVDPSKVVRSDMKPEAEDNRFAYYAESNYGTFAKTVSEMPRIAELLSKYLIMDSQTMITSGLGEDFATQIAKFMEMMKMNPEQLLSYMKEQASMASKYTGPFFDVLHQILNGTGSVELRTAILEFLKQYGDMASSGHLLNNILAEIEQIVPYMLKEDGQELLQLKQKLQSHQKEGQLDPNLLKTLEEKIKENGKVMREEIIPLFSKYISRTKDLGTIRDIMTLVTLNTARYLNGSSEQVLSSLEKLFQFPDFRSHLGEMQNVDLEQFINKMLLADAKEKGVLAEEFIRLIQSGLNGEGGYEAKQIFANVLNAMLLNESVYMPLLHLMLPINLDGNIMFSELWVDPDAQSDSSGQETDDKVIRMLVKFDMEGIGYFDVILNYQKEKLELFVNYPTKLNADAKEIQNGLSQIVANNGLELKNIVVERGRKPYELMKVFPKLRKGRDSINVRV